MPGRIQQHHVRGVAVILELGEPRSEALRLADCVVEVLDDKIEVTLHGDG